MPFGKAISQAELERRYRITEALVIQGRAVDLKALKSALADSGIHVGAKTVIKYVNEARKRLRCEDDELRAARREILTRKVLALDTEIATALKRHNVIPTWADRVACLKLLRDLVGIEPTPDAKPPRDPAEFELEKRNEKELDEMLVEMLKKSTSMLECARNDTVEDQA